MNIQGFWEKARTEVSEAIFPSNIYCMSCGSLIDRTRPYSLCDRCMKKLHWIGAHTCEKCGKALPDKYRESHCYDCRTYDHVFEKGYSCMTYGLYERELLFDYKYNGKGYMYEKFGDILYDRISCEDVPADVIIPIPVGKKRLAKRGYDQAALMAGRLSKRWGVPMDDRILFRSRETPLLRSLNPVEREAVLDGAFSVRGSAKERLCGKSVLLVDDIYTTGATADACSRTLKAAGADKIFLLTLASGGNRKPNMK